ncbi:MAG TPA: apolipoprotein N-acyltransferase [Bryobacteraceae bacterium]|nr:apolipoprotein N-acyltransferase [Bryobacteraceae bacterium]
MLLNIVLAVISGILLFLVHPSFDLALLAPVAVAPLVYALAREHRPKHRFLLGYVTGLVFWAGVNYWIHFVLATHGGMGWAVASLAWLVFLILKAVHLGIFGLLGGILIQTRFAVPALAALWVGIERAPTWFEYRWLTLGNAGINMGYPLRLAPWTGVYGLSFLFALIGSAVALALIHRNRAAIRWAVVPVLLAALPALPEPVQPKHVAVSVQPNVEERDDWNAAQVDLLHRKLEALTLQVALVRGQAYPSLMLWPEIPGPVYYDDYATLRDKVRQVVLIGRAPLLMGTVASAKSGAPLNSAQLVSLAGEPVERYDKIFPVPFGEYVPWPFDGLVRQVSDEAGEFQAGNRIVVFQAGTQKVGAFICYESAFPHLVRQFAAKGAQVFANLSNDGYFGATAARMQHLSVVRMRAAENRRWILRSTNDGVTASIDPAGRVTQVFAPRTETSGRLGYMPVDELTFYTKRGDVFAWGCAVFAVAALVLSQLPRRVTTGA